MIISLKVLHNYGHGHLSDRWIAASDSAVELGGRVFSNQLLPFWPFSIIREWHGVTCCQDGDGRLCPLWATSMFLYSLYYYPPSFQAVNVWATPFHAVKLHSDLYCQSMHFIRIVGCYSQIIFPFLFRGCMNHHRLFLYGKWPFLHASGDIFHIWANSSRT